MGDFFKKIFGLVSGHKAVSGVAFACAVVFTATACAMFTKEESRVIVNIEDEIMALASAWPASFNTDNYVEPEFTDSPERTNNAFNVSDFGEQGGRQVLQRWKT